MIADLHSTSFRWGMLVGTTLGLSLCISGYIVRNEFGPGPAERSQVILGVVCRNVVENYARKTNSAPKSLIPVAAQVEVQGNAYEVDAWSRPLRFEHTDDGGAAIVSAGADGRFAQPGVESADDLRVAVSLDANGVPTACMP
ncbi:MAG: hypothetical protein J0L92_27655 [Deltaproteobacteria bacterium]|nr:hypothetical protein [Deltaproteobacteria bacterium]